MNHFLTWCEIPVTDMTRAKAFYGEAFGIEFIDEIMEGMEMAMFKTEKDSVGGALTKNEYYQPTMSGCTAYLNGGHDLQVTLDRIVGLGGKVVWPKTKLKDDCGFFAQFSDSEGNRVGLFSLN